MLASANFDPFESPPRAFISYARNDGERFATSLRERIEREHPRITLWQDRLRMEGGAGWWRQITEALEQVEFLIMVMTPAALTSTVARKEWRYARQQGVRVCPVLGVNPDQLDFAALPTWMRKAHFYNLEKEWDTFIGFLKSARKENRVPFMAPDQREDFIERPQEFDALLTGLLDASRQNPLAITTALQGSGGFGKTTMAVALCHHDDVLNAFDDGILWATLGESPNLQHELTKLYAALTGERPAFVDVDDAAIQLAARLDDKNCLIVIDDAWDPNHVKPFLRGGRQCARLITTRRLPVVTEVGARRIYVNQMSEDQSVRMLTAALREPSVQLAPFQAMARRLGEWPLLLKLAASQLRERIERGDSPEGALAYVSRALDKRGFVAFDRANASARNDAVASTIAVSLDLLRLEDRVRCAELSIFPEDKLIPLSVVAALWGVDDFDAEELVQQLDGAALIDFDLKAGCIRIHDVLQAYLHTLLDDPRAVQRRLVTTGWPDHHALPDAYAWRWIGWHLLAAGDEAALKTLLLDFNWLRAKLAATDISTLLRDFEWVRDSPVLRLVHDALRLASNGLSQYPEQLAAQLRGRLERGLIAPVDQLLAVAECAISEPWLSLLHTSLTHPGGALTGILKGHAGAVEAVAVSADGHRAVTASADWTLRVWDLQAGQVLRILEGHAALVHAVAITPDGTTAVSGAEDRTLRVWDVDKGAVKAILRGHHGAVTGVATTPDGRRVVSVSDDGTGRVWEMDTGRSLCTFKGDTHQMRAVAAMPDNLHAAVGAGDGAVLLVELGSGHVRQTYTGHTGVVRAVAATADGRMLLSGSEDGTIRVWDVASGAALMVLEGHTAAVECVVVGADQKIAVSGGRDHTLRVWDLASGKLLQTLEGHSNFVRGVAIAASGDQALSVSWDKTIRHWNLAQSAARQPAAGHADAVSFLAITVDGARAVAASQFGGLTLNVWDATEDRVVASFDQYRGHRDLVKSLSITADAKRAVTASRDQTLRVWDVSGSTGSRVLAGHGRGVESAALFAGGTRVVSVARDRTVRLWDADTGRQLRVLIEADNERVLSSLRSDSALLNELDAGATLDVIPGANTISPDCEMALSPDGRIVVLGANGSVRAWDIEKGRTCHEALADFDVVAIAIDAKAQRAVLGSRFGVLRVWDLATGRTVHVIEGHSRTILDIVISADGNRAITAARDDTIRVWDIAAGRQLAVHAGPMGKVDTVAIAPNGEFAFSVYGDTLVATRLADFSRRGSISLDHQITAVAVTPGGTRLALGDESGRVHFLRL
jgi:WD40 repeat protein